MCADGKKSYRGVASPPRKPDLVYQEALRKLAAKKKYEAKKEPGAEKE